MPVNTVGTCSGHACSIIGSYAASAKDVVDHVGLLAREMSVALGQEQEVAVYHMQPPLDKSAMPVNLIASLPALDRATIIKMEQWALDVLGSECHIEYFVLPASRTQESDTPNSPPTYTSFSCAGFVERCYRDAAQLQLVVDEACLPSVSLATLLEVWVNPRIALILRNPRGRRKRGLHGNGPWTVLMPAYLFHAIRHFDENGLKSDPYQPVDGDWRFDPAAGRADGGRSGVCSGTA